MINKVTLIGNVGADPNYRVLDGGLKTATLRIATTERYKKEDGSYNETTEWHTVVAWRNLADVVDKWVKKGDKLYIEGSIHYRAYTDKENIERVMTTITAKELKILSPKQVENRVEEPKAVTPQSVVKESFTTPPQPTPSMPPLPPMPTSDDLPF